ncbi:MAG: glycosyltransferase family 4 protein [Candidatus Acidiferrales bacterium]
MNSVVALLGRPDTPTDGVADHCAFLGRALARRGVDFSIVRAPALDKSGMRALWRLWKFSADWRGKWVLLQYTALGWSRRGFPFGAVAAILLMRIRGVRCGVVFHEPFRQGGDRDLAWKDTFRGACQDWVIRALHRFSQMSIFTLPLSKISWIAAEDPKAFVIPIAANIPEEFPGANSALRVANSSNVKTVAVFCYTPGPNAVQEVADTVQAIRAARSQGIAVRLVAVGRSTTEMRAEIESGLAGSGTELSIFGMLPAEEIAAHLSAADVQLFVCGPVSQRRSTALAGIACGLPIVGYQGLAEGTPIAQAGLCLVPYRDSNALSAALTRVLQHDEFRAELRRKSRAAHTKYFSWDAVASHYLEALGVDARAASAVAVGSRGN